ncbi:MAG TPA: hypothetical protein DDW85_03560 [Porphyromonadaceae bacterium]|nr:hypothetical protein [Porphyromonadaceae bacterium]
MEDNERKWKEAIGFVTKHYKENRFNPDTAWKQFARNRTLSPGIKKQAVFYRVAAVIIVLLISGIVYFSANRNETLLASIDGTVYLLPDSTRAILQKDARLEFNSRFGETNRSVKMRGQIHFDVAHDLRKPFIVITPTATVRVTGTSFEVDESGNGTQLRVTSGNVSFTPIDPSLSFACTAGMSATYDAAAKTIAVVSPETRLSVDAMNETFAFENVPLKDVADLLEQFFSATLSIPEEEREWTITTTFNRQDLHGIIEIINLTLDSHIRVAE